MNKENAIEGINRRNTIAVEQALREMTMKIEEQQKRIDGLSKAMGGLIQRQAILEQIVFELKAKVLGNGATA